MWMQSEYDMTIELESQNAHHADITMWTIVVK